MVQSVRGFAVCGDLAARRARKVAAPVRRFAILLAALASAAPVQAANLFVDQVSGSDANDGLSWPSARSTVTSAIATAATTPEPDVISVAKGRYLGPFVVPANVTLLGGFPTGGGARNPTANPTILDGNHRYESVVHFPAGSDGTVLDGFTIQNPLANSNVAAERGGGILVEDSAPLIQGNIIAENSACKGAGVALYYTVARPTARLTGNVITSNTDCFPWTIDDCPWATRAPHGCGLSIEGPPGVDLGTVTSGNRIVGNGINRSHSAVWIAAQATMQDDVIDDNSGIGLELAARTVNVANVAVIRSTAAGIVSQCGGTLTLSNITVADNGGAGLTFSCLSDPGTNITMDDSILWGDSDPEVVLTGGVSAPQISFSIVRGGWAGGTNVLDADPMFVAGPEGDYYLSQPAAGQAMTSPALDAGDQPASGLGLDVRTTATTSIPDAGVVDMGYHYAPVLSLDVWRGQIATGLAPYRTVAALPFADDTGTLSNPALPLLFYEVPAAHNEIGVAKDIPTDSVVVHFR